MGAFSLRHIKLPSIFRSTGTASAMTQSSCSLQQQACYSVVTTNKEKRLPIHTKKPLARRDEQEQSPVAKSLPTNTHFVNLFWSDIS